MPDRAVFAISDDRQWLVVLEAVDQVGGWCIYEYRDAGYPSDVGQRPWLFQWLTLDTGQDAHEVLASFLGSRNEDR